jgi:hypothetical protein|tara:strand:- start:43 stop:711 length:669 start_codon:yes stop_codon:yes gene_type:complete
MALAKFLEGTAFGVLNDILSSFHSEDGGYAVPNRFEVIITRPGGSATESRKVSMRCESINLPGRNLNSTTDSNIYGPTREIVDGVTYADDINMTFQASSGLEERVFFEEWQALAFDERSWNVGYYNDYISTVDIYILDRQNQRRFGLKLHEAFPKTIGATELSQAANNELIKLAVTFSFRYWTTLDVERQRPSLSEKIFDTITTGVERQISSNLPKVFTRLF